MSAHRYWRINVTANMGSSPLQICKLELYESNNGANVATGSGTAGASSEQVGFEASKAFNQNPVNAWAVSSGTTGWLSYDFGLGITKDIVSVGIVGVIGFASRLPKTFDIQYSDDNSNWTTYWSTDSDLNTWSSGGEIFRVSKAAGANAWGSHSYWRLWMFTGASSNFCSCLEFEYRATVSGADQATGGTASSNGNFPGNTPDRAFDDNNATEWSNGVASSTVNNYLGYQFASPVTVAQWAWKDDGTPRSFQDAILQFSDDGSTWTSVNWVRETTWSAGEQKLFTVTNQIDISGPAVSTMPVWPATLSQCPILNGWDETPQPSVGAFKPETGLPIMRRRSTAKTWMSNLVYRMTNAQVLIFNTFYETTIENGSLPFAWAHPVTKVNYDWIFDPTDQPRITRTAPNASMVQFRLLRLPGEYIGP